MQDLAVVIAAIVLVQAVHYITKAALELLAR
jgi:hypothetical protein